MFILEYRHNFLKLTKVAVVCVCVCGLYTRCTSHHWQ